MLNLRHNLLVASNKIQEPPFIQSVVYVFEDNLMGSIGLIINLRVDSSFDFNNKDLFKSFIKKGGKLMYGGIIDSTEKPIILHRNSKKFYKETTQLAEDLYLTVSKDILFDMPDQMIKDYIFFLGYSFWPPGQLHHELVENFWFSIPYNQKILFDTPCQKIWYEAYDKLGFNPIHFID